MGSLARSGFIAIFTLGAPACAPIPLMHDTVFTKSYVETDDGQTFIVKKLIGDTDEVARQRCSGPAQLVDVRIAPDTAQRVIYRCKQLATLPAPDAASGSKPTRNDLIGKAAPDGPPLTPIVEALKLALPPMKDRAKAASKLEEIASLGDPRAMLLVSGMYADPSPGSFVKQDCAKSQAWLDAVGPANARWDAGPVAKAQVIEGIKMLIDLRKEPGVC